MKKTLFYATLLLLAIASCKDEEKPKTTPADPSAALLIGKWDTKTYQAKLFRNNNLELDSTFLPPYTDMDLVEYWRFTDKYLTVKLGNETEEIDPLEYFKKGDYIIIKDGPDTDTLCHIENLTDKEFKMTFIEKYTDDDDEIRRYEIYTTTK